MRILHIFDHSLPLHSGYTFRSYEIIKHQRSIGWETIHLTGTKHYNQSSEKEEIDGLMFYRTYPKYPLLNNIPIINQYRVVKDLELRISEICELEKPDIIHAHSPCLNGMAAIKSGARHSIPVVYEMRASWEDAAVSHGTTSENSLRYKLSRYLETYTLNNADAVTTICEGLKNDIIKRGIRREKITVIPNAVDIKGEFNNSPGKIKALREKYHLSGNYVLGFIGSFYHYEGLDVLLRAMPNILTKFPDTVVLLVGGGIAENDLKKQCKDLNINDNVIFVGRVPHADISEYYEIIDLLVYPRLSIRLTEIVTPLKPLEAMAEKRLFVASDIGGHREMIVDKKTGILFEAGNHNKLSSTVCGLIDSTQEYEYLLKNAYEYVKEFRNWGTVVNNYRNVYESLASNSNAT